MTSAAKCALLHGGRGCCSESSSQLLTWPLLVSPRHPCGLGSSVSCRLVWGCARPLSDRSVVWLQENVFALPMSYFWMTFSTRGTPCGRWVTGVNRQLWKHPLYFISEQCVLRPPKACLSQRYKTVSWNRLLLACAFHLGLPGSVSWAVPGIFYLLPCLPRYCGVYASAKLLRPFSAQPQAEASGQCTQLLQEFSQGKRCWTPLREGSGLPASPLGWWRWPDTKTSGVSLEAWDALCLLQLELGMMSRSKTLARGLVALACFANRRLGRRWDTTLLVIKSGITKSENFAYCTRH